MFDFWDPLNNPLAPKGLWTVMLLWLCYSLNTACLLGQLTPLYTYSCPKWLSTGISISKNAREFYCNWPATSTSNLSRALFRDSDTTAGYQAATSLHDPFNPQVFTATEAAPLQTAWLDLLWCQASAALHDFFMPPKP